MKEEKESIKKKVGRKKKYHGKCSVFMFLCPEAIQHDLKKYAIQLSSKHLIVYEKLSQH